MTINDFVHKLIRSFINENAVVSYIRKDIPHFLLSNGE